MTEMEKLTKERDRINAELRTMRTEVNRAEREQTKALKQFEKVLLKVSDKYETLDYDSAIELFITQYSEQ